jgi:16S rRNA (cytidine1402-2'-O)-methyltransferase
VGAQLKKDIKEINKKIFFIKEMIEAGLYLVATPIGNLDDITLRALNVLKNSKLILCENTLNSKKLLNKYEIKTSLDKYTDHDFEKKKDKILNLIKTNNVVSLISDSGSPLISDPGSQLIHYLLKNKVKIISIPGPSAMILGIQLSGFLNKKNFTFLGFLPKKHDQKVNSLKEQLHNNLIIYTTKEQVPKDVSAIREISNNFEIIILKELTKMHEERIMLNSKNIEEFVFDSLKGELVLCVSAEINTQLQKDIDKKETLELIEKVGIKKAYQEVKTKYKMSRNDFYKFAMKLKND